MLARLSLPIALSGSVFKFAKDTFEDPEYVTDARHFYQFRIDQILSDLTPWCHWVIYVLLVILVIYELHK